MTIMGLGSECNQSWYNQTKGKYLYSLLGMGKGSVPFFLFCYTCTRKYMAYWQAAILESQGHHASDQENTEEGREQTWRHSGHCRHHWAHDLILPVPWQISGLSVMQTALCYVLTQFESQLSILDYKITNEFFNWITVKGSYLHIFNHTFTELCFF